MTFCRRVLATLALSALALAGCNQAADRVATSRRRPQGRQHQGQLTLPDDTEITSVGVQHHRRPGGVHRPHGHHSGRQQHDPHVPHRRPADRPRLQHRALGRDRLRQHLRRRRRLRHPRQPDHADQRHPDLRCDRQPRRHHRQRRVPSCPIITAITAIPGEVTLGNTIALEAEISHGTNPVHLDRRWAARSPRRTTTTPPSAATSRVRTSLTVADQHAGLPRRAHGRRASARWVPAAATACSTRAKSATTATPTTTTPAPDCRNAECGDGYIRAGVETCDDMNNVTEECAYGLRAARSATRPARACSGETDDCGDGTTNAAATRPATTATSCSEECAYWRWPAHGLQRDLRRAWPARPTTAATASSTRARPATPARRAPAATRTAPSTSTPAPPAARPTARTTWASPGTTAIRAARVPLNDYNVSPRGFCNSIARRPATAESTRTSESLPAWLVWIVFITCSSVLPRRRRRGARACPRRSAPRGGAPSEAAGCRCRSCAEPISTGTIWPARSSAARSAKTLSRGGWMSSSSCSISASSWSARRSSMV